VAGESPAQLGGGPNSGLAPGSRVAGYIVECLVGVGGMAAVYRARDERLNRVVALKLLVGDESLRTRFVREARSVAAVDHPHIIPVYAAGEADGVQYIAMRFVAGDTLQGVIRTTGALPPRRVASLVSRVASALDAAHAVGLVHRDVKPGNILVDAPRPGLPEHPYLTDFGIARAMMSAGTLTVAGQFLGTPDYSAPEQINGQPVDGRADQYALACVAYEMLSGAVPFKRDSAWSVLYAHLNEAPPLIAVPWGLPPPVHEVLSKALAKSPGDRFDTCADFASALREALGLDPYDPARSAPPTPTLPVTQLPVTKLGPVPGAGVGAGSGAQTSTLSPDRVPRQSAGPGTWQAVVSADRAYFETVDADEAGAPISFPAGLSERRIPLAGAEVRIGRRSSSQPVQPQIDLNGPPRDPGVSRQHAKLVPGPDGTWSVVDLGTDNGITVNGRDVPSGHTVPLRPGDQIHLGAWTRITIVRG
jgi:serine/threonine protein kinase